MSELNFNKPVYLDVEHLENMYVSERNANIKNQDEKHKLEKERDALKAENEKLEKMIHMGIGFEDLIDDTKYGEGLKKYPTYVELQAEVERLKSFILRADEIMTRNSMFPGDVAEWRSIVRSVNSSEGVDHDAKV